ncbi:hypothetical protein [Flavobacterium psychrotrophum]|uniref:hypothetical protein n=1 Tax=Flavobacterium psychrotrophum TaxID=2294119 RepID=UPI000E321DAA|nr:hypothetical protein [Flavobacterium psychrotrophum]
MKNVLLPGLLSAVLLMGCSSDTELTPVKAIHGQTMKFTALQAENKLNPYDSIGRNYRVFLSEYQNTGYNPTTFSGVSTAVATIMGSKAVAINNNEQALLSTYVSSPSLSLTTVLANSTLSQSAKDYLTTFTEDFITLRHQPFASAYTEIVNFEDTVMNSTALTTNDQRVLFTVTSLARYSLDHSCCEDTDWETSVGNIVAATAGALTDSDRAIQYLLITRIAQHENITF